MLAQLFIPKFWKNAGDFFVCRPLACLKRRMFSFLLSCRHFCRNIINLFFPINFRLHSMFLVILSFEIQTDEKINR